MLKPRQEFDMLILTQKFVPVAMEPGSREMPSSRKLLEKRYLEEMFDLFLDFGTLRSLL